MAQNLSALVKNLTLLSSIGSVESHKKKITKELNKNIKINFIEKKKICNNFKKKIYRVD